MHPLPAQRQGGQGPLIPASASPRRWIASRQASLVLLAVVLLAVIGLSLNPRPESVLGRLSLYDKAGHFAAYVVLAFLAARVFDGRGRLFAVALAVAAAAALGGAIELVQPLVGRHRDLLDFVIDLAGSAVGAAVSFLVLHRHRAGDKA